MRLSAFAKKRSRWRDCKRFRDNGSKRQVRWYRLQSVWDVRHRLKPARVRIMAEENQEETGANEAEIADLKSETSEPKTKAAAGGNGSAAPSDAKSAETTKRPHRSQK